MTIANTDRRLLAKTVTTSVNYSKYGVVKRVRNGIIVSYLCSLDTTLYAFAKAYSLQLPMKSISLAVISSPDTYINQNTSLLWL